MERLMERLGKLIVVMGATGQQGGSAVDALKKAGGWRVRAVSRDPGSDKAKALDRRGVEVVRGDMEDPASLDAAFQGAYGVFSVSIPMGGVEAEVRQGKNVAEAAQRAGVQHFLFTSVCGAERSPTGIPGFDSKAVIEAHIRALGLPSTVLRPVSFMDNFQRNRDALLQGRLSGLLAPSTVNWYIAVRDIGAFIGVAFLRPQEFLGQAVNLAGVEMSMAQVAEAFGRVVGRPVVYVQTPREEAQRRVNPGMLAMNDWFEREGYRVDVPALRARWGIPLMTFEEWLRATGWAPRSE